MNLPRSELMNADLCILPSCREKLPFLMVLKKDGFATVVYGIDLVNWMFGCSF